MSFAEEVLNMLFEMKELKLQEYTICPDCLEGQCEFQLVNVHNINETCTCRNRNVKSDEFK